ncbi:MAG: response regulator [Bacteroidota bacterium]|nr:response regulator [Bacteroidota bacterium]
MKTILLIEDDKIIRENTAEILELSNYNVLSAENGKIGLAFAIKNNPDLILCDIAMPVMDGFKVLKELNNAAKTIKIPFIFLTAKAEESEIMNGIKYGANDYLPKPFRGDELLSMVAKYLKV